MLANKAPSSIMLALQALGRSATQPETMITSSLRQLGASCSAAVQDPTSSKLVSTTFTAIHARPYRTGHVTWTPWNRAIDFSKASSQRSSRSFVSLSALQSHVTLGNCIIAANILGFIGQQLTDGRLTQRFMKSNYHIQRGEWWRLITPTLLHADIMHLLVNCYSLYNLCSMLEPSTGSTRLLLVYLASAVTGNLMSYYASKSPAVGASTSLFGLTASEALFLWRHQHIFPNSSAQLTQLLGIVAVNVFYGFTTTGIDNWGHLGGFLGGLVVSFLVGPRYVKSWGGLVDKPPIPWFAFRR